MESMKNSKEILNEIHDTIFTLAVAILPAAFIISKNFVDLVRHYMKENPKIGTKEAIKIVYKEKGFRTKLGKSIKADITGLEEKKKIVMETISFLRKKGLLKESIEQVDLKNLRGKTSTNYNGDKGKILAAALVKNYKELIKYDNSGWLNDKEIQNLELEPTDILVAFEDEEGVEVYTYGLDGLDGVNEVNSQNLEEKKKVVMETISFLRKKGLLKEAEKEEFTHEVEFQEYGKGSNKKNNKNFTSDEEAREYAKKMNSGLDKEERGHYKKKYVVKKIYKK